MSDLVRQQTELREVLERAADWLENSPRFTERPESHAADLEHMGTLRVRAASTLINLALVGHFSSGKSFLLSGLQQRLHYTPVTNDLGDIADKYVGLLPSASEPTSACPATVIPVDRPEVGERGALRVRFTDSDDWEEVGTVLPAVVAAYCTDDPEMIAEGRHLRHQHRTVAEVEILVSDVPLPAKLYDLPGAFSPHPVHDAILQSSIAEADCFIYVAQAANTLSDAELGLIKSLYDQHVHSGKQVIWVLTGIDRANDLGRGDRPQWEHTVRRNNEYLAERFCRSTGDPDKGFIGRGFMGVSPALHARGQWEIQQGDTAKGNRLIAASRMNELRRAIGDIIETTTGATHLARVAGEALGVIAPYFRAADDRLRTAKTPLENLATRKDSLVSRLDTLDRTTGSIREQLGRQLQSHVRLVNPAFAGLAAHLHDVLDDMIRSTNLMNAKEANRVDVQKTQAIQEWVDLSNGPIETWNREIATFIARARLSVGTVLRDSYPTDQFDIAQQQIDLNRIEVPSSPRHKAGTQDLAERAAALVSTVTPVSAGVAAALGVVSGPLLLVPAGIAVGAGLAFAALRHRRLNSSSMDLLREEWIDDLDTAATQYATTFMGAIATTGQAVIDRAEAILMERSSELANEILHIEHSIDQPENIDLKEVVDILEPHVEQGRNLMLALDDLTRVDR